MKKNEGIIDRAVRVIAGLGLLSYAVIDGAAWAYIGVVPLFTGLVGTCPLYSIFGISTCGKCSDKKAADSCACGLRS